MVARIDALDDLEEGVFLEEEDDFDCGDSLSLEF